MLKTDIKSRIFYLSWIAPIEGSGATLAMRRHFVEHRDFEVFVATTADFCEPGIPSLKLMRAPWLQRLSNTRFVRLVRNFELLFYGTLLEQRVVNAAREFRPDAVFTVADMTLCEQARKLANLLGVPLVVNFQDWWPRGQFYYDFEKPYFWARPILERRFRRLYREADLAFCTSEGMKEFLGLHPNSHVLYPIGARDAEASCPMLVAPEDRRSAQLSSESTSRAKEIEDRGAAEPPITDSGGLRTEGTTEGAAHRTTGRQDDGRQGRGEVLTTDDSDGHGYQKTRQGDAQGTCASAFESDSLASELADSPVSESLIRSADAPASLPATSHSLLATAPEALSLDSRPSSLDSRPQSPATSDSLPVTAPEARPLDAAAGKRRKRRLIYTGTAFGSYGKMLRELARELENQEDWELVIFGNTPDWPKAELERAKASGLYRGLLKFDELQQELQLADACLAVMSFEPELEVMMRTSFTTKMLDYCRVGKPLILWGPEYCSPIRLASSKQAAKCITTNSASIVLNVLKKIILYPDSKSQLEKGAKRISENELSHIQIHRIFREQIKSLHEKKGYKI